MNLNPNLFGDADQTQTLLPGLRDKLEKKFIPHWNTQWGGKCILHGRHAGSNAIRLDGNDYLNISNHPQIVAAQIKQLQRNTRSILQSGAFSLESHPVRKLETDIAHWIGKKDGFICQSGYTANTGLIQAVADEKTPVYVDGLAHMSLWEGVRAARATGYAFRHNDYNHLARVVSQHGPGLVLVDSIYSTTGAVCNLTEIIKVVEYHGCNILVDESHSLGTHGPQGAGLCAELGLTDRVHFITASLAKAFAGRAGFFTVPTALRYYILHHSFPNIFSSALLAHEIAGLAATLEVIRESTTARQCLQVNTKRLRSSLTNLGYPIHQGSEQIIALEAGTEPATIALRDLMESHEIFGSIFCAPATSQNRAMVRLTLNAGLTECELKKIEESAKEIAPLAKPWNWPIAKRKARQIKPEITKLNV
jgi:CAI-1 autoinducer synthase